MLGAGAHGYFEAYGTVGREPIGKLTRAKLFQDAGKRTPLFIRISTVVQQGHPGRMTDTSRSATKTMVDA